MIVGNVTILLSQHSKYKTYLCSDDQCIDKLVKGKSLNLPIKDCSRTRSQIKPDNQDKISNQAN